MNTPPYITELRATFANAGGDYDGSLEPIESFMTAKIEEAKTQGRNEAVDYMQKRIGKSASHATWELVGNGWKEMLESARNSQSV